MADAKKQLTGGGGLDINVVTPYGPITHEESDAIIAPGEMGEFEVLPGHIPFLTALHAGVMTIGERLERTVYAVGPGYLRVGAGGDIEVLVESAVLAKDIDLAAAKTEINEVRAKLEAWKDKPADGESRTLADRRDWAQAQLDAHARMF